MKSLCINKLFLHNSGIKYFWYISKPDFRYTNFFPSISYTEFWYWWVLMQFQNWFLVHKLFPKSRIYHVLANHLYRIRVLITFNTFPNLVLGIHFPTNQLYRILALMSFGVIPNLIWGTQTFPIPKDSDIRRSIPGDLHVNRSCTHGGTASAMKASWKLGMTSSTE